MTIEALLARAKQQLIESGSDSPSLDAALLLCHVLQQPRSYLLTWPDKELDEPIVNAFDALLTRRSMGEPIAYIIGEREFWSLPLKVSPTTLIPRPDTERLVELALEKALINQAPILDLGTGTGAIVLALASELPNHQLVGVDLRSEAVELAQTNRQRLAIDNVTFLQGSWFQPINDGMKFAVIVSNPPYIDEHDPHLVEGDVRFEPRSALVAADNGLADIKSITATARDYLIEDGWLLFEHGYQQGADVRAIFQQFGYQHILTEVDYAGNDRVTLGQYRV